MTNKISLNYCSGIRTILKWSLVIVIFTTPAIFSQQHLDDQFSGSYRKSAKTSIVRSKSTNHISKVKKFKSPGDLISYLPDDSTFRNKYPDLKLHSKGPANRKKEEYKNVQVDCWIYAVKYEGPKGDKDFHIIIGGNPDTSARTFMNVEVSGLPPAESINYVSLKNARKQFLDLFSAYNLKGSFTRIKPPVKVRIKGSLFFDGDHDHSCETCPGPSYAKPGTVWEIHPVYSIVKLN